MLQNLPAHYNDPAFREDALRGLGKAAQHIDDLIKRLTLLRQEMAIRPAEVDLNELVAKVLATLERSPRARIVQELRPLPKQAIDSEQLEKVIVNLLLNAHEALNGEGEIRVATQEHKDWTVVSVSDNGCGMPPDFVQRSLFRPFQTTKKHGIGIGMFQSKMIVEAHHGRIEVESEVGKGTTFRVLLPVKHTVT
jgi:signal transduction histidine kinase